MIGVLLLGCSLVGCGETEPPPPPAVSGPVVPPCEVDGEGELETVPTAWVEGSTPDHAVWRVPGGWAHDGGRVDAPSDEARAWIVHDQLWTVADGATFQRHPLEGGEATPLELAELLGLEGTFRVGDVAVVGVGGLVSGLWVSLVADGAEGSLLAHLVPDAATAGWVLEARYPPEGLDPVRYGAVRASASRAAVAFEEDDGAKVRVVSRRAKPLRVVSLPRAGDGEGPSDVGLLGQGVLAVMPDGRVVVDRPGHRHGEVLPGLRQLALGSEGLIALTDDGLRTRVRKGVELADGLSVVGTVWGVGTRSEAAVVLTSGEQGVEVVRGPMQPPTSGPSWAPRVAPPFRCMLPGTPRPLLPPLLGADGRVRLAFPPPDVEEGQPPLPGRWVQLAPPPEAPD